jgi:hypothetical protein
MRTIIILVFCSFLSHDLFSQAGKAPLKYSLSAEVGKTGLIYSIVFDNTLKDVRYGLRGGAGSNFGRYTNVLMALVGGYRLIGSGQHFLETGVDLHYLNITVTSDDQRRMSSLVYPDYPSTTFYITLNAGYRLKVRKVVFRVGAAPGFTKDEFVFGSYVSCGLRF